MHFETFKDSAGEHRWRLKARNGEIIATSGEGYKNRADMLQMIAKIKANITFAEIRD